MQSLEGGADVFVHKAPESKGLASWARNRWSRLQGFCGLGQALALIYLWRSRRSLGRRDVFSAGLLLSVLAGVSRYCSRLHKCSVDRCFERLRGHPQLRSFGVKKGLVGGA